MTFAEKMVLALFSVRIKNVSHYAVDYVQTIYVPNLIFKLFADADFFVDDKKHNR